MNPNDFFDLVNKYKKQNAMQSSASGKAATSSRGGSQPFPYLVDQYKKEEEEKMKRYVASFDSNDIAPFSSKDDERVGKWFKKGALEDGFTLKGLGKNIVGTWQDIDRNVTAAVFDATEALIDTHAYGAGMIGGLFDKGFQDDVGNFIAKDLLNPTTGEVDSEGNPVRVSDLVSRWGTPSGLANKFVNQNNTEANSFFGDNMDGMVQSTAHMVGSKALERLGVPGWLTQGVNAFGGELEQAFQNNATFRQAGISAGVSAVAEAITERLSSGIKFKGSSFDDGLQRMLKTGIENKLIRTILKYESDIVGEGLEEVASEALSSLGRKFTYMKDEDWSEVLSLESLFDAFVGGALMGGVFGGANIVKSKASGVDATSGLTANEEKVVNKLYEDEVAKRKAEGNLKAGDKTKIYDKLVQDMQKGYIETDVIESVLGGDSYNAYRDAVNNESRQKKLVDALIKESDKLEDIPTNQLTGKQQLRRDELRSIIPELQNQIRNNENSTTRKDLKSKLENEVMNMVRGDRLSESYAEKARVYQKLDIDPETFSKAKHADAAKQTVASAVELGANNTNRVRDLVEHAAQISGKTGKAFFFKDNDTIKNDFVEKKTKVIEKYEQMENRTAEQNKALAELKQLVEDVKSGKRVINGENTADGIVLNIDSKNPLMVTVGHEVTHDTENAKSYDKMKKALFAYASTKGIDVQTRIAMAKMVYEGAENANAEQEVVADLAGEMLFTDDAFVEHLARTDTNVFQNLWNDIKNLVKMATPGSKEAKELANLEHKFEKAFREANKAKKTTDTTAKNSISANADGLDIDDLELFLDDSDIDWDEILGTKWLTKSEDIAPIKTEPKQEEDWLPATKEGIKQMYNEAVDRGDIAKAQKIVDEVAKRAGYTQKGYHGTDANFNAFSENEISARNVWGKGFYFGTVKSIADDYRTGDGRVISAYLKMENPFIPRESSLGTAEEILDRWFPDMWQNNRQLGIGYINGKLQNDPHDLVQFIADHNGIEIRDVLTEYGYDSIKSYGELVVFSPDQIKSSDPITFDDDGNWINIDERFNPETDDIRYSLTDSETNVEIGGKTFKKVDGTVVGDNVAKIMNSPEYSKPKDYMTQYSISTEPAWEKSYLEQNKGDEHQKIVWAVRDFTDKMVQNDAIRGYVPMGDYKYSKFGPLRTNQEYIWTFDMDTSCPRTFQFLNFRDAIQRKAGRYLSYNESINLLELMRAYGQQIPCCYCYVENKRVLLSASYNNFFGFRNDVLTAATDADAEKVMYGYDAKKGLPKASRKALERWRSDLSYNPSLTEVWTATNTARNSVLNFLDNEMAAGRIDPKTAETKLNRMVIDKFGVSDKGALVEIESFVKDWTYDTLANIPHIYNTVNDTSVSAVDERALALNHEALAYAKSSSSAKGVENYVPYTDQLKNVSEEDREYIMGMGGIRKHSSNDFRMDYVQDYFMFYADLAAGKWTGHTYTKSTDFTKVFACTGDRINMSIAFYEDADGSLRPNTDEGAAWKDVQELRKAYKNVGSMAMVTSDAQLSYALNAGWIDMIIPFHASGLDKSVWYNLRMWNDYTSKQGERFFNADTMKQKLKDAGVAIPKGAKAADIKTLYDETFQTKQIIGEKGDIVKPHFYPGDTYVNGQLVPGHHNNAETYFKLCEEYGVHPRFYGIKVTDTNGNEIDVTEHPSYIKLIKETSRIDTPQEAIQFNFGNYDPYLKMTPFEYAMNRLNEEAKNGGFENTKDDPYGVVQEFIDEYLNKDKPLGYLTERAKETRDILLEMSRENARQQNALVEKESQLSISSSDAQPVGTGLTGRDILTKQAPVQTPANYDVIGATPETNIESRIRPNVVEEAPVAPMPVETAPVAPMDDIAPVAENATTDDIAPMPAVDTRREVYAEPDDIAPVDGKRRKWIGTSTESEVVDGQILPDDLDQELIHYQPISNKKTLGNANSMLDSMGYESSVSYMNQRFASSKVSLDDIALGERLIQEAVKRGDTETAKDLIMDISILGTELGQKVQALSIIKRLTPEGQLKMLMRTVERGKAKNDKAFEGVEVTNEMAKEILDTRNADGTYDQDKLNAAVENVKQKIAKEMKSTILERINEWRYLSMLGNPKTHIRNLVSNVAMYGTRQFKNAIARTGETLAGKKIERTKTWKSASKEVRDFAKQAASQEYGTDKTSKYSEAGDLKSRRQVLKIKALDVASKANSAALSAEDTWFSKPAYRQALQEYLTANGIRTEEDIQKNGKLIAQAKQYAKLQAQEATFQQDSYIASKINEIERKNPLLNVAVGSIMPYKKTPINIAKTGLAYSPLGFARNVYDAIKVSKGEMSASTAIDHFAQTLTGTSLALIGYALASRGALNGAGKDDKEGKYDYQLGKQAYSFNFDGDSFSLSWLSPVAMPLFVGANAYEILVEDNDWDYNVLGEALAQTLDPMNEMSFLSSLTDVLSSYDSGMAAFGGMLESAAQSYITSFVPTLSSQIAQVTDDKKRSTKIDANSGQDFLDETWNQVKYKIPGFRQTLAPSTDIWGNEIPLSENAVTKALETFILPYSRKDNIATKVDEEIKEVYRLTGENGVIPNVPYNYINYKNEKYEMTAAEHTEFKKVYGQTAYNLMEDLIYTDTYRNASPIDKAKMMDEVFSYAQDKAKQRFLSRRGVTYTNATKDNVPVYKDNAIKGAVDNDMTLEEYKVYQDNPGKYAMSKAVGGYEAYTKYSDDLGNIKADKDKWGQSISGSRKPKVREYIYSLDIPEIEKHILFKSQYTSFDTYNDEIVDYLYSREDISWNEMREILLDLGFKVTEDGRIKG